MLYLVFSSVIPVYNCCRVRDLQSKYFPYTLPGSDWDFMRFMCRVILSAGAGKNHVCAFLMSRRSFFNNDHSRMTRGKFVLSHHSKFKKLDYGTPNPHSIQTEHAEQASKFCQPRGVLSAVGGWHLQQASQPTGKRFLMLTKPLLLFDHKTRAIYGTCSIWAWLPSSGTTCLAGLLMSMLDFCSTSLAWVLQTGRWRSMLSQQQWCFRTSLASY